MMDEKQAKKENLRNYIKKDYKSQINIRKIKLFKLLKKVHIMIVFFILIKASIMEISQSN